jgi:hypothetical protein
VRGFGQSYSADVKGAGATGGRLVIVGAGGDGGFWGIFADFRVPGQVLGPQIAFSGFRVKPGIFAEL